MSDIQQIVKHKKGDRVKEWYMKCDRKCQWNMGTGHGDYDYLDNACYLSGSFALDCPDDTEAPNV